MHSASGVLLFLVTLVATCHAYSTFETNCSVPSHSVNYVSSPKSRGTLDILWSCLFTLVACTWTIQHLNVPEQRDPARDNDLWCAIQHLNVPEQRDPARDNGFWCDVKWSLNGFWSSLKWMIFTMLAPEFIFAKALGDLIVARRNQDRMQRLAKQDKVEWSLAHSFFADMGGFVGVSEDAELDEHRHGKKVMARPLTAEMLYWLRTTQRSQEQAKTKIEKLPDITTAELLDKSKGDVFVKIVAAMQVFWVALQIVVRAAKGLPISQLELAVAAFSTCAVITYIFLLSKPQGVRVPTRPIRCERGSIEEAEGKIGGGVLRILFVPFAYYPGTFGNEHVRRIPNDFISTNADEDNEIIITYMLGFIVGGIIFGGIHVAGWNLTFPTPIEQLLWRIASILLVTILPAIFLLTLASPATLSLSLILASIVDLGCLLLGVSYVLVRLFMLVEIFRTLLYLPPDAYISTWASSLPHVA